MSPPQALACLASAVDALAGPPGDAGMDGRDTALRQDIAVITRRLAQVEHLIGPASAGPDPMAPAARQARHDLMNALGAIDNHAELIVEDHNLDAARAVRAATRALVEAVRQGTSNA